MALFRLSGWFGAAVLALGPMPRAAALSQVGVLPEEPSGRGAEVAIAGPALESVSWDGRRRIRLGGELEVLGEALALAVEPGLVLRDAADVPGGRRAPFRFRTELAVVPLQGAGLGPAATRVLGPRLSDGGPMAAGELPLVGPGLEFLMHGAGAGADERLPWAFVRVLHVGADFAEVEVVEVPASVDAVERDPAALTAAVHEDGLQLQWAGYGGSGAAIGYTVRRRAVGESEWKLLGAVAVGPGSEQRGFEFVDASAGVGVPRVFEYEVRLGQQDGVEPLPTFGALVRGAPFGEEALGIRAGLRVDLVSGRSAQAPLAGHLTVQRSGTGAIALMPEDGVRFAVRARGAEESGERDHQGAPWRVADPSSTAYLPGRAAVLRDGDEAEFVLPSGLQGRLRVEELTGGRWLLFRDLSVDGSGILPRAPGVPSKVVVDPGGEVHLSLGRSQESSGIPAESVAFVVEAESPLGSGQWSTVTESSPGASVLSVPGAFSNPPGDDPRPIVRWRLRQRVAFGPISPPSETFDVLAAGTSQARRADAVAAALLGLDATDFGRRLEARAVLMALGADSRAALEALLISPGPESRRLAAVELLDLLDEDGPGDEGQRRRKAAQLESLAVEAFRRRGLDGTGSAVGGTDSEDAGPGEIPAALLDPSPAARAFGLLGLVDRAERGALRLSAGSTVGDDCRRVLSWVDAIASADADPGVRWLAQFLGEVSLVPSLAVFDGPGPAWLLDPAGRTSPEPMDLPWSEMPGTGDELAWRLESRPELSDLELGSALARLHTVLGLGDPRRYGPGASGAPPEAETFADSEARLYDYDARTAELYLRLLERARRVPRGPGRTLFLEAAKALLPGADLDLAAWRRVSDYRMATPNEGAPVRTVVELDTPSLELLQAALGDVGDSEERLVDLVLAEGEWGLGADLGGTGVGGASTPQSVLEIRQAGVRIRAKAGAKVRILGGVRIHAQDVALEGLTLHHDVGQALTVLAGGHAVAKGCTLRGAGTVVHLQDGDLELFECRVECADLGSPPATSVRLLLPSRLFARATLFDAGSLFISSGAEAWLDRCVLDASSRTLVQAQESGALYVRESLLRGTGMGLFRVQRGLLAGVVVDVPRDPLGRLPQSLDDGGIRVSPRLFRLVQEGQQVPSAMKLPVEPLRRVR